MNLNINKNEPVMVTGATGFVASELIKKLLETSRTIMVVWLKSIYGYSY